MSHTSHHQRRACQPSTTRRPSTLTSLLTTSWKTLNQEQLALEMWTCRDPLCRAPHHQIPHQSPCHKESPTDSRSIPSIVGFHTWRPCPTQSSEDGSEATHSPHPCIAVNPPRVEGPDQYPRLHPTVPHFVVGSPPKVRIAPSHARPLRPLPQKKPNTWRQHMTRQQLATEAALALLSGVISNHSHPSLPRG
jgi:hypothetical protein